MDPIRRFTDNGRLEPFRIERAQLAQHVRAAYQDLAEARATFPVSDRAAYVFAYTAMLKIGRAVLFLHGYRPKGFGQHETVVEAAGALLGKGFAALTERFDRMRRKRNLLIYEVGGLLSHADADTAFKTAEQYLDKVRDHLERQDPQLRFEFRPPA
ncbi:MAG: hypothetical protein A3C53_01815 [Omnitrophica WOR_2 bacterium RIFCSPHIGHO2_02_FULL_68_15]|nr:MAG: hypothetical protein A3C53_01815 [Omnitrophica WOR_2 bacterium RIFCSPHIGHO2_02_FULL_68_15]